MNMLSKGFIMNKTTYPTLTFNNIFNYQFEFEKRPNAPLTILYIHGLASNPWGKKPEAVKTLAQNLGFNFFRFELAGHGIDCHNYDETDLEVWKQQTLDIINNQIDGDIILVGHCIGGWTSLLTAISAPHRVKGVVCTSTSPNLYKLLMHLATKEQKAELEANDKITVGIERMSFTFTKRFMECARANDLTAVTSIPLHCPIHLIQGLQDTFIDWRVVLKLADKMESQSVQTKILKSTNHHIQKPADLREINNSICDIAKEIIPQLSF